MCGKERGMTIDIPLSYFNINYLNNYCQGLRRHIAWVFATLLIYCSCRLVTSPRCATRGLKKARYFMRGHQRNLGKTLSNWAVSRYNKQTRIPRQGKGYPMTLASSHENIARENLLHPGPTDWRGRYGR